MNMSKGIKYDFFEEQKSATLSATKKIVLSKGSEIAESQFKTFPISNINIKDGNDSKRALFHKKIEENKEEMSPREIEDDLPNLNKNSLVKTKPVLAKDARVKINPNPFVSNMKELNSNKVKINIGQLVPSSSTTSPEINLNDNKLVKNKSIFINKNPIGYEDLDFEVVREIKNANSFSMNIKDDLNNLQTNVYIWRQDDIKHNEKILNDSIEKVNHKLETLHAQLMIVQHEFAEHETAKNKDFNDVIREVSILSQNIAKVEHIEKNNSSTLAQIVSQLESK